MHTYALPPRSLLLRTCVFPCRCLASSVFPVQFEAACVWMLVSSMPNGRVPANLEGSRGSASHRASYTSCRSRVQWDAHT